MVLSSFDEPPQANGLFKKIHSIRNKKKVEKKLIRVNWWTDCVMIFYASSAAVRKHNQQIVRWMKN